MKIIMLLFLIFALSYCSRHPGLDWPSDSSLSNPIRKVPKRSGLKAGFADDNNQFNYFLNFLEKYSKDVDHYKIDVTERIQLKVLDQNRSNIPNADIKIYSGNVIVSNGRTYSDGSYFFYPSKQNNNLQSFLVKSCFQEIENEFEIIRNGNRYVELSLNLIRPLEKNIPLDILFILDTTGSMGEEIQRLLTTIDIIQLNLTTYNPNLYLRFGLVLYKDLHDSYRTKTIPLTDDVESFRKHLQSIEAEGGGDKPEDLQLALEHAIKEIEWDSKGIRLGFIITDAPPHLDYGQTYTYVNAANDAKSMAIKLFSIGTGGLNIMGELILRQISQYTYAKYIFLTYGESGESEGGKTGSVSHHTGANYETDKLEAIIIRFAKEEVASFLCQSDEKEEYFQAQKIEYESREETLKELFDQAISQLIDYATIKIQDSSALGILPLTTKNQTLRLNSEYFTENLILSAGKNKTFILTERNDLQKIMDELSLQITGLIDEKNTVKVGKLLGANILLTGDIYAKEQNYEIFLKLLRVETGEILSITKLKVDKNLGLEI